MTVTPAIASRLAVLDKSRINNGFRAVRRFGFALARVL